MESRDSAQHCWTVHIGIEESQDLEQDAADFSGPVPGGLVQAGVAVAIWGVDEDRIHLRVRGEGVLERNVVGFVNGAVQNDVFRAESFGFHVLPIEKIHTEGQEIGNGDVYP
jgi:hypothetical protein